MENKGPFSPAETEFVAPNEEQTDDVDKKETKKKKNKFQVLLEKLIPRKTTEDDEQTESNEEEVRGEGLFDRFKGTLNNFFGVEKTELPENDESQQETTNNEDTRFRASILAPIGLQADFEPLQNGQNEESAPVIGRVDKPKTVGMPESVGGDEVVLDEESNGEVELPILQSNETLASPSDLEIDQTHVTPVVLAETPIDNFDRNLTIDSPKRRIERQSVSNDKETIIERGGGGGAALLGFVAAETLSRSRDKKLKKEAEQLRQKIDKLETTQQFDNREIQEATRRNDSQIEDLRQKRSEGVRDAKGAETISLASREEKPNKGFEKRLESQKTHEAPPDYLKQHTGSSVETPKFDNPEVALDKRILLEQVERAAEKDVALEGYYERRAEVKDVPSTITPAIVSSIGGSTHTSDDLNSTGMHNPRAEVDSFGVQNQKNISSGGQGSLYKDAARQGALVGLAIIGGLLIIALFWNLL